MQTTTIPPRRWTMVHVSLWVAPTPRLELRGQRHRADDASCYYTLPSVIINEIHYNPCGAQGDDFDYEFVELMNIGDVTVDLSGYEFYNESAGDDQLSLVFPEGTSMAASEFIVLVVSEAGSRHTVETVTKCLCLTQATSATLERPFPCATPLETW